MAFYFTVFNFQTTYRVYLPYSLWNITTSARSSFFRNSKIACSSCWDTVANRKSRDAPQGLSVIKTGNVNDSVSKSRSFLSESLFDTAKIAVVPSETKSQTTKTKFY